MHVLLLKECIVEGCIYWIKKRVFLQFEGIKKYIKYSLVVPSSLEAFAFMRFLWQ